MLKAIEYVLLALGGWCAFAILFVLVRSAFYAAFFGIYPWGDAPYEKKEVKKDEPFDPNLN